MKKIDVAKDFHSMLTNRNENSGDGKHTAVEFRDKFLSQFDNIEAWLDGSPSEEFITLDFNGVTTMGPGWIMEAIGYFSSYEGNPHRIIKKIKPVNLSKVKMQIFWTELLTASNPLYKKVVPDSDSPL